jgi:hypothetical protein
MQKHGHMLNTAPFKDSALPPMHDNIAKDLIAATYCWVTKDLIKANVS